MTVYETIETLCKQNGETITDMCRNMNLSRGALGDLKSGKSKQLSLNYLQQIADYFSVSVDSILGNGAKEDMLEELKSTAGKRTLLQLLDGATEEDIQKVIDIVKVLNIGN